MAGLHHGSDNNFEVIRDIIDFSGVNCVSVIKNYNLTNLIVSCDCLITKYSTVGLEAMILEKPVICLNVNKDQIHYIVNKAAFELSNCNEMPSLIKQILENPSLKSKEMKQFTEMYNYKNDGLATQRVYRTIIKLLKITQN